MLAINITYYIRPLQPLLGDYSMLATKHNSANDFEETTNRILLLQRRINRLLEL